MLQYPSLVVEAIAGLIPIHLHLKKLSGKSELRAHSLLSNHIFQSLMGCKSNSSFPPHPFSLSMLTACQCNLIRGHLVDMNNWFNIKFSLPLILSILNSDQVIELFNHFSFHLYNKKSDNHRIFCLEMRH